MTGPKSIDISPLKNVHLEHLGGQSKEIIEKALKGSKFSLVSMDPASGNTEVTDGVGEPLTLEELRKISVLLQRIDGNQDSQLTTEELKAFMFAKGKTALYPEALLKEYQELIQGFYAPVAKNMQGYGSQLTYEELFRNLNAYNTGLYKEESRRGQGLFKSTTKALSNIPLSIPSVAIWAWEGTFGKKTPLPVVDKMSEAINYNKEPTQDKDDLIDLPFFLGDRWAHKAAVDRHGTRKAILEKFEKIVNEDLAKNETWAVEMNLEEGLKKLSEDEAEVLREELVVEKHFSFAKTKEPQKKYQLAQEWAQEERAFGGGPADGRHFYNPYGNVNNFAFARGLLEALSTQATIPGNDKASQQASEQVQDQAIATLEDMDGDGGAIHKTLAFGAFYGCNHVDFCDAVSYERFSDEDSGDLPGRLAHGVTLFYGGQRGIRWGRQTVGPWIKPRVARWTKPIGEALLDPKHGLKNWVVRVPANAAGSAGKWVWGKTGGKAYDMTIGKYLKNKYEGNPKGLAEAEKGLKASAQELGRRASVDWLLAGAITFHVDSSGRGENLEGWYNHDLDLQPWVDPTKPDPFLVPTPKK